MTSFVQNSCTCHSHCIKNSPLCFNSTFKITEAVTLAGIYTQVTVVFYTKIFKCILPQNNHRHIYYLVISLSWQNLIHCLQATPEPIEIYQLLSDNSLISKNLNTKSNLWRYQGFLSSEYKYSRTSLARTCLGQWIFIRDMGSSSHWGLIIAPGLEAYGDNVGKYFCSIQKWYLDEAILMSTHNIHFHDEIRKFPRKSLNICLLELSEEFCRDPKTSSN